MKNTLIVNLFGAPGSGKSTAAAYLFAKLKMAGVDAELVTEFAKDKVWEENFTPLKNQIYMLGKQSYRIARCAGKVDVIVTDSPIPLSIYYNTDPHLTENFDKTVIDVFNSYTNVSYFLHRDKPYNPNGRNQTEEESDEISHHLYAMLKLWDIPFSEYKGNEEDYNKIFEDITKRLAHNQ